MLVERMNISTLIAEMKTYMKPVQKRSLSRRDVSI